MRVTITLRQASRFLGTSENYITRNQNKFKIIHVEGRPYVFAEVTKKGEIKKVEKK